MTFWQWLASLAALSAGWWALGYLMGRDARRKHNGGDT
jgi:hypothetical protein